MKSHIGVLLAAIVILPFAAAAQDPASGAGNKPFVEARGSVKPVPRPPGGPTPRLADGKPDFSGVWFPGPTGRANAWSTEREAPEKRDPIPFQPWAEAKFKSLTRVDLELASPNVNCTPVGTPGMWTDNAYVHQIVMKPGLFVHLIENNNRWKVVHTDGRPHKPQEELEPLFNGDSVGRWEGDTLVIDSISIDERAHIQDGWFHSDALHVVERIRRPSMNYLEYQYTIEDPKVLTKPWTSPWERLSLSVNNEDLTENFCTNNENVEELKKLSEIEAAKKK